VVKVSGGGDCDKGNCRDNIFIGNLICNVGRIIIKPQPNPPIEPPEEEDEIKYCPQDAGVAQFSYQPGKSREQLCSEQPEIRGCQLQPPKDPVPPIAEEIPTIDPILGGGEEEPAPECTDPETGVPILCNILGEKERRKIQVLLKMRIQRKK
jgi:hypothetical protein